MSAREPGPFISPSLEGDEGNINVADVSSLKVQNKTADIKCLSLLKQNFNGISLRANLREGKQSMKNNYWQCKHHCHKQREEASQINVKLPKLIRCIPSMIL